MNCQPGMVVVSIGVGLIWELSHMGSDRIVVMIGVGRIWELNYMGSDRIVGCLGLIRVLRIAMMGMVMVMVFMLIKGVSRSLMVLGVQHQSLQLGRDSMILEGQLVFLLGKINRVRLPRL